MRGVARSHRTSTRSSGPRARRDQDTLRCRRDSGVRRLPRFPSSMVRSRMADLSSWRLSATASHSGYALRTDRVGAGASWLPSHVLGRLRRRTRIWRGPFSRISGGGGCGGGGSGRAAWRVADCGEQGRVEVQAVAEIEAGWVERELDGRGPEIQLIASAMAAVAEEDVSSDLDREAVGSVLRTVERTGTTPLVTTDSQRDVVQLFEHRTDGDQSAQGAVVETRHTRDLARVRKGPTEMGVRETTVPHAAGGTLPGWSIHNARPPLSIVGGARPAPLAVATSITEARPCLDRSALVRPVKERRPKAESAWSFARRSLRAV